MQSLMAGMQSKGNWLFKKKNSSQGLGSKGNYTNTGETRVEIVLGLFFSFVFRWMDGSYKEGCQIDALKLKLNTCLSTKNKSTNLCPSI